jgi:HEAT repeat protein
MILGHVASKKLFAGPCGIGLVLGAVLWPLFALVSQAGPDDKKAGAQSDAPKEEDRWKNKPVSFWIKRLQARDVAARKEAVQALAVIGPGAYTAVPALVRALDDDETVIREGAIIALGKIGPRAKAAVPALVGILRDKDFHFQIQTFAALRQIGPEDKKTTLVLARLMLHAKTTSVQGDAAVTLYLLGPKNKAALPLFKEALRDQKLRARHEPTVVILGAIGLDAAPLLAEAVQDRYAGIRNHAVAALKKLGPAAAGTLPALKKALEHEDGGVRAAALAAISAIDAKPMALLTRMLADDDEPGVRRTAADGLASLGPKAKPAMGALIKALADRGVTGSADLALKNIGSDAVGPLVKAMKDNPFRGRIILILAEMGPKAKAAVPALIPLLKDKSEFVRSPARTALARIGEDAVPALVEILADKNNDQACLVLCTIGPAAKAAVPALIKLLKDPALHNRARAARTLGMIGRPAKEAVPLLRAARKDANAEVQREADQALLKIRGE